MNNEQGIRPDLNLSQTSQAFLVFSLMGLLPVRFSIHLHPLNQAATPLVIAFVPARSIWHEKMIGEVCHHETSIETAASSILTGYEGAVQGHWTYPAVGKETLAQSKDPC